MSHKIIKPEGIELIEYLNNGYAICNRCGAVMRQTEDPKTGCGKDLSLRKLELIPQQHSEDCSIVLDRQRNN